MKKLLILLFTLLLSTPSVFSQKNGNLRRALMSVRIKILRVSAKFC
ncbi:MAG: hypothetical protein HC817_14915 [Saprospiraceae bacterium]|nr:hypothetical protein [Saprospiraceae bacterium]